MTDIHLEQAILGTCLIDRKAYLTVFRLLRDYDFTEPKHQIIFYAMQRMAQASQPIDLLTVTSELRRCGELMVVTPIYITSLTNDIQSSANLKAHCALLRQTTIRRKIASIGEHMIEHSRTGDPLKLHAEVINQLSDLTASFEQDNIKLIGEYAEDAYRIYEAARDAGGKMYGLETGFAELDQALGGLKGLIYMAARPSMGKTSLAMQIAYHQATTNKPVLFVSLETSGDQLAMRQLSLLSEINGMFLQSGQGDRHTEGKLRDALYTLSDTKIFIHVTGSITPLQLNGLVKQYKAEHGIGLVVIDFVQLMEADGSSRGIYEEVTSVSRGLKRITQDENLPILALSQLSREVEKRASKRPQLSDLRESGGLEQDADQIIFLHRPEWYGMQSFMTASNMEIGTFGLSVLDVAKNKFGSAPKEVLLRFIGAYTKFCNM